MRRRMGLTLLACAVSLGKTDSQEILSPPGRESTVPRAPVGEDKQNLDDLIRLGLDVNPKLAQVNFAIENARGRALQVGLYPNPTVDILGNEVGDRTGPGGIWTTPLVGQEIVTRGKLKLNRAAAQREVDQTTYQLMYARYSMFASIRGSYFEILALQKRMDILDYLVNIADRSVDQTRKLLDARQVARLDLVQLEIEAEKLRADREATEREFDPAYRSLAASIGLNRIERTRLAGDLETPLPEYDLDRTQAYLLEVHPEVQSAQVGVEKARILLRRAQVEPYPNFTLLAGYTRQNQNLSNDYDLGVSLPIPVWNRNQGNIQSARANIGESTQQIGKVQNELTAQLGLAFRDFASSRRLAERYKTAILPRAKEAFDLSMKAYQGGQFEYLRVLTAERALAQANLEYVKALRDAWKAASVISGLALEDEWPPKPVAAANP
jgi:cobalt-zinc-cadmium efflux system outer membrane protein